jgi:hypothetical protein
VEARSDFRDRYSLHDLDNSAGHVIRLGRAAVVADFAVRDEINVRLRRHRCVSDPSDVDLRAPAAAHQSFFKEHPFVLHLQRTGDVPPMRLSDWLSHRQYHEMGLYREALYSARIHGSERVVTSTSTCSSRPSMSRYSTRQSGKMHLPVEVRQVVLMRRLGNLALVAIWPSSPWPTPRQAEG